MSVFALLSFCPAFTVFLASNSVPGPVTLSADATARLTGSTSAHALAAGQTADVPLRVVDLPQLDQLALGEMEQRGRQAVLRVVSVRMYSVCTGSRPGGGAY